MGKLTELLAELADEEGLDPDELEALLEVVKRRKAASGGGERPAAPLARAPREEPPVEFPAGPNAARAIERRGRQSLDLSGSNRRGLAMYGEETSVQAYERWMDQEQADPEGVYGPGGGTAGGIFGDGAVAMPDYDPGARRRTESAQGGVAMARLSVVLERLLDRVESLEGREPSQALAGRDPRRLRGKR
jgi:hypothetical protein